MRSATCSTSASRCEEKRIVRPLSRVTRIMPSRSVRRATGSRPIAGSSMISSSGCRERECQGHSPARSPRERLRRAPGLEDGMEAGRRQLPLARGERAADLVAVPSVAAGGAEHGGQGGGVGAGVCHGLETCRQREFRRPPRRGAARPRAAPAVPAARSARVPSGPRRSARRAAVGQRASPGPSSPTPSSQAVSAVMRALWRAPAPGCSWNRRSRRNCS